MAIRNAPGCLENARSRHQAMLGVETHQSSTSRGNLQRANPPLADAETGIHSRIPLVLIP